MTRPDDIPEDAWDVANAVMQLYFHGTNARNQDQWDAYVLIAASAILADRAQRSALAQPSAPEEFTDAAEDRLSAVGGEGVTLRSNPHLKEVSSASAARPAEPPPAGFDAVDLDMIKSGDRLGPALGQRVFDALSRATRAEERIAEMEAALEWYGENARLCRLIHSGGDAGRHALAEDGGKRARATRARGE